MALRKLLLRPLPEVPPEPPGPRSLIEQALASASIAPLRLFWEQLAELRPWWPVLLPLLLWVGWRTYQRERAAILEKGDRS
jgi:hypothetical protein